MDRAARAGRRQGRAPARGGAAAARSRHPHVPRSVEGKVAQAPPICQLALRRLLSAPSSAMQAMPQAAPSSSQPRPRPNPPLGPRWPAISGPAFDLGAAAPWVRPCCTFASSSVQQRTRCWRRTYSLLTTHCLLNTCYSLLTTHYSLLTAYYYLPQGAGDAPGQGIRGALRACPGLQLSPCTPLAPPPPATLPPAGPHLGSHRMPSLRHGRSSSNPNPNPNLGRSSSSTRRTMGLSTTAR